jgi:hypothetical protein
MEMTFVMTSDFCLLMLIRTPFLVQNHFCPHKTELCIQNLALRTMRLLCVYWCVGRHVSMVQNVFRVFVNLSVCKSRRKWNCLCMCFTNKSAEYPSPQQSLTGNSNSEQNNFKHISTFCWRHLDLVKLIFQSINWKIQPVCVATLDKARDISGWHCKHKSEITLRSHQTTSFAHRINADNKAIYTHDTNIDILLSYAHGLHCVNWQRITIQYLSSSKHTLNLNI